MNLSEMLEVLDDCPIEIFSKENFAIDISWIKMLTQNQTMFLPNILYFGHADILPDDLQMDYPVNILCYGDIKKPNDFYRHAPLNLLVISENVDAFNIYNQLQELFLESQQVITGMRTFLDMLYSDSGLQGIADAAYSVFGNPLFVVDNSYKYMAISSGTVADSLLMEQENTLGQIAEEGIHFIRSMQIDDRVRKSSRPIYFLNPVHGKGMMVGNITIHNIEVGHVMIYEVNKPFVENDYELLKRLCRIISVELQKNSFYKKNKGIMFTYFLADLLDNSGGNNKDVKGRLKTLGCKLKEEFYVFSISMRNNPFSEAKIEFIINDLIRIIPDSLYVTYQNSIVLLIHLKLGHKLEGYALEKLFDYLNHNQLVAGISHNFRNLQEMRHYYEQSLKAASLGYQVKNEFGLYKYEDMSIFHIMEICEKNGHNLLDYCHPALEVLIQNDKTKNTEFLNTLYQYLNFSQNTMRTSEALHIHKNTLLYRIDKIKKITGNPLDHGDEMIKLHFSFKILQYLKII